MSDALSKIPVGKMSATERNLRSHLVRLSSRYGFLHATLNQRERMCGKSNCKCARGEKHSSLYVVTRQEGKLKQLFVPQSQEAEVKQWVERYQQLQALIDGISEFYWSRIENRES